MADFMQQLEGLPENPTIDDVIKQMRLDHKCRDEQHNETSKTLKWNNFQTMLTLGSLVIAIAGGMIGGITGISKATSYFDTINSKLNIMQTVTNDHTSDIKNIQSMVADDHDTILQLAQMSKDNHKILDGVNSLVSRKIK